VNVDERKTYRVRFFAFNNARNRPEMTIHGARAFVSLPHCSATDIRLVGTMSATNAVPNSVRSVVHFLADKPFKLVPDEQQAKVCFRGMQCPNGTGFDNFTAMPDMYTEQGAPASTRRCPDRSGHLW
jgi:hypothetical protein